MKSTRLPPLLRQESSVRIMTITDGRKTHLPLKQTQTHIMWTDTLLTDKGPFGPGKMELSLDNQSDMQQHRAPQCANCFRRLYLYSFLASDLSAEASGEYKGS